MEKRVQKRGRTEQKKLTFAEGEEVWVHCVKSGKWKDKGTIESIRVADDGTIKSKSPLAFVMPVGCRQLEMNE